MSLIFQLYDIVTTGSLLRIWVHSWDRLLHQIYLSKGSIHYLRCILMWSYDSYFLGQSNSILSALLSAILHNRASSVQTRERVDATFATSKILLYHEHKKRLNLLTRGPFCMDHLFSWTGGVFCTYCRHKHNTNHVPRRELEGVDLNRRLTQDEWKDVREGNRLE